MENDTRRVHPVVVAALGFWTARMTIAIGAALAASLLCGCGGAGASSDAGHFAADATANAVDLARKGDLAPSLQSIVDAAASCPPEMVAVADFCMDRYEAPNEKGVKPLAMETAPDGQAWCVARGKRLCAESEWVRACQGPDKKPYPYGTTYVHGRCDDDKTWISPDWTVLGMWPSAAAMVEAARLYQADPSGARPGCVSDEGVYDLTGNVAEWVASTPGAHTYSDVMKGCYWSGCYGGSPPSCGFVNPAHPGTFRSYEAGFRCCRDL